MSLRVRLSLLITFLFLLALLGGSSYVINGARHAVENEMRSSVQLASQLVELLWVNIGMGEHVELQHEFYERLNNLGAVRHLQITVVELPDAGGVSSYESLPVVSDAPEWFVSLVKPPPFEFHHVFSDQSVLNREIVIRADPSDEISEAWNEAKDMLLFLLLFVVTANIFIYLILGRDLAPIESILGGLSRIEKGDYQLRLPQFKLPELDRISEKFNHMADVLQRSQEENRYLTQHSLAIQEQARRHLAQELHDELGQSLSAVKAVAVSIQQRADEKQNVVSDNAGMIISFVDRMYEVAHSMMQRLRPSVLDELGLVTAVQELIDGWNERHSDAFCHFKLEGELPELNDIININVYRIVQESLTNISKYAKANEVYITLGSVIVNDRDYLTLYIKDNGIGFDSLEKTENKGLGILGIRERVQALEGEFGLNAKLGEGVEIKIRIPLLQQTENEE